MYDEHVFIYGSEEIKFQVLAISLNIHLETSLDPLTLNNIQI